MLIARQSIATHIPIRLVDADGIAATGKLPADVLGAVATVVKSDGTTTDVALVNASNWFEVHATKAPGLYHILLSTTNLNTIGPTQLAVLPAGTAFVGSISAFLVEIYGSTTGSISTDLGTVLSVLGTPAGVSVAADVAAVKTDTTNIYARIGAPVGASISADIALKSTASALSTLSSSLSSLSLDVDAITGLIGTPDLGTVSLDIGNVKSETNLIATLNTKLTALMDGMFGKWELVTTGDDANRLVLYKQNGDELMKFDCKDADGLASTSPVFKRIPVEE